MRLMKDGKNMLLSHGKLNDNARRAIAGLMDLAPSLTAFGNKIPTSYFRLVPHQEAPTNICWGMSNRSASCACRSDGPPASTWDISPTHWRRKYHMKNVAA